MDLVAKLASLEQGLDRAGRLAEKEAAQIERAFSGLKVAAAGLGGVIAGAFPLVLIQQFFTATIDGLDRLNDLKDATGASIENISALEDVALRTGTSFESMSGALVKLNSFLKEADPGSKQAELLKAIGLSAKELKALDPAEALLEIAKALDQFEDDGNKARIVQELFGKSIQEVAPFLKDLADKGKLVATVTKQQAEEAERFNKQLAALQKDATDAGRAIVSDLLPALSKMSRELTEGRKAYGGWLAATLDIGLGVDPGRSVNQNLTDTVQQIAGLKKSLSEIDARRSGGGVMSFFTGDEKTAQRLREQIQLLERREQYLRALQSDGSAGGGRGFINPGDKTGKPKLGDVPDKPDKPGKESKQRAERLIDGIPIDRVEAFRQSELAATAKVNEALATDQLAEAERNRTHALALEEEQINATAEWHEKLNKAEQDRLDKLAEDLKKTNDEMTTFSEEAARNIQDALGDTVLATLEGDFDSIEDSWKRMLNRLISEAIAADIGKALFGNGKPSLEGAAGQLGNLFGGVSNLFEGVAGAVGGYFGAENPSSKYAVNGSDFGFKVVDLPANGVELAEGTNFVPYDGMPATLHRGEAVVPAKYNPAAGGMGGGMAQHNTIYIDGRLDQASTAQLINQALQANNRAWEERMAAQGRR